MVTLDEGGAGRQTLRLRRCEGAAATLAELSWVQPAVGDGGGASWRIVPDVHPHLVHHRLRDDHTRTMVVGARSTWTDVDQGARAFTVGVRLRPGVLPALLGVDAWELRDRSVPVADAFGARGRDVASRLRDEQDPELARALLVSLVAEAAADPRDAVDWRVRGFVAQIERGPAHSTVRRQAGAVAPAAAVLGISERSLRDACRSGLGLRPKEAHRIARLHAALAVALPDRPDARVATAAGYADQAHFIREGHALLGETPEAFRRRGRAVSFKTA
jgi:AraC-like DNA-binding protein